MGNFSKEEVVEKIRTAPVVPLFTHGNAGVAKEVVKACYEGGIRAFEYTNRAVNASDVFRVLLAYARNDFPDLAIGIGTVYNQQEAEHFAALGADFIIQPVVDAGVAAVCAKHQLAWIPGAMTLTEIYTARQLGAAIVKIFPADTVGPGFIKAVKGPMPDALLMATGGVEPTAASLESWFGAGAFCVGMGSQLFTRELLEKCDYAALVAAVRDCLGVVAGVQIK